jgi:5'-phosphate synthase pdxT subunit
VTDRPVPLTFIRAPKILNAGKEINVLLKIDDYIAAVESKSILVTVFHPELTSCLAFHRYFAAKCGTKLTNTGLASLDSRWESASWTRLARIA